MVSTPPLKCIGVCSHDSGDLRGVAGGDGGLGCLCGKAGTSHLCDGSAHSSGCVVNGYGCLLSYIYSHWQKLTINSVFLDSGNPEVLFCPVGVNPRSVSFSCPPVVSSFTYSVNGGPRLTCKTRQCVVTVQGCSMDVCTLCVVVW